MPVVDKNNLAELEKYESFIKSSPYGHFMQSVNWAKVKNNWESDYIYLEDEDGNIIAAISILSVKNDGINSFMYAPRGPVCDIEDKEVFTKLIEEARQVVKDRNGFLLRIDPEVNFDEEIKDYIQDLDIEGLRMRTIGEDEHSFSNPRMHMMADISGKTFDDYFNGLRSKDRNRMKIPYKENLNISRIRRNDEDFLQALDIFYELTKIMAERQGISYRPKEYFLRMFDSFDDMVIYQSSDENEVLASSIVLNYNKKSFYAYSASSNENRKARAPYHINLEAIKDACEINKSEYDMGGIFNAQDDDGLYGFKKVFCGEEGLRSFIGELDIVYNEELYKKFISR